LYIFTHDATLQNTWYVLSAIDSQCTNTLPHFTLVVFQDLRPAEAYLQLFDALEHVNKLSDDIFGKITARVSAPKNIRIIEL